MQPIKLASSHGLIEQPPPNSTASAARDFESLLLSQLLSSAFPESEDQTSQTMMEFGREHFARVIASGGGIGLGAMIEGGLSASSRKP